MQGDLSEEVIEALPRQEQRAKFVRFVDLMRLLGDCIIADDYSIPDATNVAIHLSPTGEALRNKVATAKEKDRVPAKEAKLLCALAIGQRQLFVDIEATDLDGLARSISDQILAGRIRFPMSLGRDSYDKYAQQFDEGQPLLTYAETQRFLDETPVGVQQYGRYVTGPFGLQESSSTRQVHSGRRIEAFHCSDQMCDLVHRTHLATSENAAVNSKREQFNAALDDEPKDKIDWFGAADEIRDLPAALFNDSHVGVVATLVGDGLDLDELRALVAHMFDQTAGRLRDQVKSFLTVNRAEDAVSGLDRASLMQIVLMAKESSLHDALDALVEAGSIKIPEGEVRRPVVNINRRSGAFGLLPELGQSGIRFASADDGFATLRLRHELSSLFDLDDSTASGELTWQLRHIDGESLEEQLDTFFRVTSPAEAIERLVLTSREKVDALAKSLNIKQGLNQPDSEIVQRFMWKLGYPLRDGGDPRAEFWRLHQRLAGLTKASHSSSARDSEEFLGVASKFFRELERYLSEALAFAAWALLHDHASDPNPYEFGLQADNARGMELVQEAADAIGDEVKSFDYLSDKLDLYTMIRGFEFLSKALKSRTEDPTAFARDEKDIPAFARGSQLKRFPFTSRIPFLNLTERSQTKLVDQLRDISRSLLRGKVNDIRNEHQHYRRTASGVDQIDAALREIEISVRALESLGFGLVEYRVEDTVNDRWGRSEYYFQAPRGARHVVTRPSHYDWLGLPALDRPQYIVQGAVFAEPNEVLRFQRRLDSPYAIMWDNYPDRRRPRGSALSQSTVEHPEWEVSGE